MRRESGRANMPAFGPCEAAHACFQRPLASSHRPVAPSSYLSKEVRTI
jgi:hypothetical protein